MTGDLYYIGQSIRPRARLTELWSWRRYAPPGTVGAWLLTVDQRGLRPGIEILDETDAESADDVEMAWIGWALSEGYPLTNKGMSRRSRAKWYPTMPAARQEVEAWEIVGHRPRKPKAAPDGERRAEQT